jgi:hypothetical protein
VSAKSHRIPFEIFEGISMYYSLRSEREGDQNQATSLSASTNLPFIVDDDGGCPAGVNEFVSSPGYSACTSDLLVVHRIVLPWMNFLAAARNRSVWEATDDDLIAYHLCSGHRAGESSEGVPSASWWMVESTVRRLHAWARARARALYERPVATATLRCLSVPLAGQSGVPTTQNAQIVGWIRPHWRGFPIVVRARSSLTTRDGCAGHLCCLSILTHNGLVTSASARLRAGVRHEGNPCVDYGDTAAGPPVCGLRACARLSASATRWGIR